MTEQRQWQPRSVRLGLRPPWQPMTGIPDELRPRLAEWFSESMWTIFGDQPTYARIFALGLGVEVSADARLSQVINAFQHRMTDDEIFAFDVIDELLRVSGRAGDLNLILDIVDHELKVSEDGRSLVYRVAQETQDTYLEVVSIDDHASALLKSAWANAFSMEADPKKAWENATEAVEFLLKPVVSPNDAMATISKMARALRDAPQKWECSVPPMQGFGEVESFAKLLDIVGHHPAKHGTPKEIDLLTARTVVLQSITVCQWLRDKALRRIQ